MRVDWLGANALRELEDAESRNHLQKLVTWIGRKKESFWEKLASPVVFIALLLPVDPVIVAVHYQKRHSNGLGWRDWGIFLFATIVANAWWMIKIGAVVEAVLFAWRATV